MTLPASGAIDLGEVDVELGYSASATISLNDAAVRSLFGISSGSISLANGYGKSHNQSGVINITIASNIKNYNIFTNRGSNYIAGNSVITLTINSGVVVGSTSRTTYSLDTGSGWTTGDTISIVNNGYIAGAGGNGGRGGSSSLATGGSGLAGGPGINLQWPVSITNANGYIYSGGGGGGGGGGSNCGGGGGAGSIAGVGGRGSHYGVNGGLVSGGSCGTAGGATGGGVRIGHGGVLGQNGDNGGVYGGGGGGGGASGGHGGGHSGGHGGTGGGHGLAIHTNGKAITWVSGNTRVYGGIT
jgi:hypothetical protein